MTGLTGKGAATRQRIIEGAAAVIREIGVGATTLDDIRIRTATSKSQLFHYFPNGRNELLLAVAQFEADRVLRDQQPHLSDLSTWESWQRWRVALLRRYRRHGTTCPLAVLMSELGRTDPAAQAVTRSLLLQWRHDLAAGVRAMQATRSARASLDPDRYAGAVVAGIQGGVAILLATGSSADLEAVLDLLLDQLRTPEEPAGFLPKPESGVGQPDGPGSEAEVVTNIWSTSSQPH
jgi:AcrR family transcriptional regulator